MTSYRKGSAIVIMGVSGSGKSTIGGMLAEVLACSFLDADDYHSQANKEKMSKGIPLSEEDRIPWLETLSDTIRSYLIVGKTVVLSCSALQKKYREILRAGDDGQVKFVCLQAPVEVIAARLERRARAGNHFMPATLLQSQLELLQIDTVEGIIVVDATLTPQVIVDTIKGRIMICVS
ncbi:gluconokinase [Aristolochia californica]|uniref:gluconokinase n=1 Tax=Aristolochia californica TaxID=171875 RepID=UPI0035DDF525